MHQLECEHYTQGILWRPAGSCRDREPCYTQQQALGCYISSWCSSRLSCQHLSHMSVRSTISAAFQIDLLPVKYWPRFLPGGRFKADVEVGSRLVEELFTIPILPVNTKEVSSLATVAFAEKAWLIMVSARQCRFSLCIVATSPSVISLGLWQRLLFPVRILNYILVQKGDCV